MLPISRFGLNLIMFSLVLVAGFLATDRYLFQMPSNFFLYYSVFAFFMLFIFLTYRALFFTYSGKPTAFVNKFMASLMIKLFLFMIICVVSGYALPKAEVKPFIIFMICIYISYTVFMTYYLMVKKDGTQKEA